MSSNLNPKPNRKIAKFYPTPNISMFILKMVANAILDSTEVVSSPDSTVYKKSRFGLLNSTNDAIFK